MARGIVSIVGRPNVGKSTLFNALTQTRHALVDDQPGVTRDRIYGLVEYADCYDEFFVLVDTGGFETKGLYYQPFAKNIVWDQTQIAIDESDCVIFLLDAQQGVHPHDQELLKHLRAKGKSIIAVVNKADNDRLKIQAQEFYSLGVDSFLEISAAHMRGVGDLREMISEKLRHLHVDSDRRLGKDDEWRVAIVGRPNVGKSSILNRLLSEERSLVSDVAGTTRDAIDSVIHYHGQPIILTDTAGIRKRSRVKDKLEVLSVIKSLKAIEESQLVVLVVDAVEGFGEQEQRLAHMAIKQYRALLVVVNKWDLVEGKDANTAEQYATRIRDSIKSMAFVTVIFVSCAQNQRVFKILDEIAKLKESYEKRVSTSDLNRALETLVHEHTPALMRRQRKLVKFYYATQVKASPPTIVIKCNVAEEIQESYKRYMQHRLREMLGFENTPLRLLFRGKSGELPQ